MSREILSVVIPPEQIKTSSPFSKPFSEFGTMSTEQKIELNNRATEIVGDQVNNIFDNDPKLRWLIIYGSDGKVITPRLDHELPNSDKAFLRLGQRTGVIPFVYLRPVSYENISFQQAV